MTKNPRALVVLAVCVLASSSSAWAQADLAPIQEIEAVGSASTNTGNKAAAMARAEQDAVRQAVEKVAEQLIGHDAVVSGYPTLKEQILKKPNRYLKEYQITSRVDKGNTAIVKMVCQIQADVLASDLEAIGLMGAPQTGLPKVMVLPDPKGKPGWWEGGEKGAPAPLTQALVDALESQGFQVVQPVPPKKPLARKAPVADIRKFAASQKADIYIAVRWDHEQSVAQMEGLKYLATRAQLTSVGAFSSRDGAKVVSVSATGVVGEHLEPRAKVSDEVKQSQTDEAFTQAAGIAASRLAEALGAKGGQPAQLKLVVAGLGSFAEYVRFQQAMASKLSSVSNVMLASAERGEVSFDVTLAKSSEAFADELGTKKWSDFTVKVTERKADRVVVHVQR